MELSHLSIVKGETELENGKRKREDFGAGGDVWIRTLQNYEEKEGNFCKVVFI